VCQLIGTHNPSIKAIAQAFQRACPHIGVSADHRQWRGEICGTRVEFIELLSGGDCGYRNISAGVVRWRKDRVFLRPELAGDADGVDAGTGPPCGFVTASVHLAMSAAPEQRTGRRKSPGQCCIAEST